MAHFQLGISWGRSSLRAAVISLCVWVTDVWGCVWLTADSLAVDRAGVLFGNGCLNMLQVHTILFTLRKMAPKHWGTGYIVREGGQSDIIRSHAQAVVAERQGWWCDSGTCIHFPFVSVLMCVWVFVEVCGCCDYRPSFSLSSLHIETCRPVRKCCASERVTSQEACWIVWLDSATMARRGQTVS